MQNRLFMVNIYQRIFSKFSFICICHAYQFTICSMCLNYPYSARGTHTRLHNGCVKWHVFNDAPKVHQPQWRSQRGPGPPSKPHHKIFTDYEKYETCPVNRKVKSITGSVFVFVSREAVILAQNALETVWRLRPDPLGELTALPQTP